MAGGDQELAESSQGVELAVAGGAREALSGQVGHPGGDVVGGDLVQAGDAMAGEEFAELLDITCVGVNGVPGAVESGQVEEEVINFYIMDWSLANFGDTHILGSATWRAQEVEVRSNDFSRFQHVLND